MEKNMPILKCKICGGSLNIKEGQTVCECEYCGTKQTLPKLDNERKLNSLVCIPFESMPSE